MKHIDREKKTYETLILPGPAAKKDAPTLHDDSSPFGNAGVEAKKKEAKKAALIQAAALSK